MHIKVIKTIGFVAAILVGGCGRSDAPQEDSAKGVLALYGRSGGGDEVKCDRMRIPNVCASTSGQPLRSFTDCSDDQYECIFDSSNAMAVPKAGLTLGQKYSVFGANFAVERCFGDNCETATISSRCEDESGCGCLAAGNKTRTKFYFSRTQGILAFYTTSDDFPEVVDESRGTGVFADAVPSITYYLVAKQGFLRTPLALEKSSSEDRLRKPGCALNVVEPNAR